MNMRPESAWRPFLQFSATTLPPEPNHIAGMEVARDSETVHSESRLVFDMVRCEVEESMRMFSNRQDESEKRRLIETRDAILQYVMEIAREVCDQFAEVIGECLWPAVRTDVAAGVVDEARMRLLEIAGDVLSVADGEKLELAVCEALNKGGPLEGIVLFELDHSRLVWHLSEFMKDVRGHVDG